MDKSEDVPTMILKFNIQDVRSTNVCELELFKIDEVNYYADYYISQNVIFFTNYCVPKCLFLETRMIYLFFFREEDI